MTSPATVRRSCSGAGRTLILTPNCPATAANTSLSPKGDSGTQRVSRGARCRRSTRGILEIERAYAAQADGAIDAMEGFALVAGLGSAKPTLRATGPGTGAAKQAGHGAAQRSTALSPVFRKFTRSNFRHNLTKLTGVAPKGAQAHHIFPVQFASELRVAGINIHHPKYGAWWAAEAHLRAASAYNQRFRDFFLRNSQPTKQQILDFGRALAQKYGLDVYF